MDTEDDTVHSSTRYHCRCYAVDPAHLTRIVEVMKTRTQGEVEISLFLDETETISGKSLDGVLRSSILDAHKIVEVRLNARRIKNNGLTDFSVYYKDTTALGPIRVSISGMSDAVVAAREDIERIIRPTARRYWLLNIRGSLAAFMTYFVINGAVSMVLSAYSLMAILPTDASKSYPNLIGAAFIFLWAAFGVVLWQLRDRLFPALEFRMGISGIAAERRDAARKYLLGTILAGSFLGFVGKNFWEAITSSTLIKR